MFISEDTGNYQIVRPGKMSPELSVPDYIQKPSYFYKYEPPNETEGLIEIKRDNQANAVRDSCVIAATILEKCANILAVIAADLRLDAF